MKNQTPEIRLAHAMKKNGISRQHLADSVGISLSSVAMMLTNAHRLRRPNAFAIQAVHGISARWLMDGIGGMMLANESSASQRALAVAAGFDRLTNESKKCVERTIAALKMMDYAAVTASAKASSHANQKEV